MPCELRRATPIPLLYLNGTKSFRITYVWGSGLGLEVYADADYADNLMMGVRCLR